MSTTATWLQTLQAQPWFNDVAQEFASIAPSVPTAVWEGELYVEDSSLDPTAQDYANSGHWGLFQEDVNFPTKAGLPVATVAQLQDPRYNAYVAAQVMQRAIQNAGATTLPQMVQALENVGWPGQGAPASEYQTRIAAISAIAGGSSPSTSTSTSSRPSWCSNPWDPRNYAPGPWSNWQFPSVVCDLAPAAKAVQKKAQQTQSDLSTAIQSGVASLEKNLMIGGVILGLLAGGFALLAASVAHPSVEVQEHR